MPHAGYADPVMNDEHGSHSDISDRSSSDHHSSHRGNFTNPRSTFLVHEHSFIHSHACINTFSHIFIHTLIPYIQALHMQLLHHNASHHITKW